jgi:hypothetical protein
MRTSFKMSGTPGPSLDTALDRHVTSCTYNQHALRRPATTSLVHERPERTAHLEDVLSREKPVLHENAL